MKKILYTTIVTILFGSCGVKRENTRTINANVEQIEVVAKTGTDSIKGRNHNTKIDTTKGAETDQVPLNDIRFAGWTKKEWVDNDYIRAVRKYIDAYNSGKIKNPDLDEHKKYIQGKFVIADIQPYLIGGALIYIIFYDHPEKTFSAHVYSDVDEKTRVVSNYECRGLKNEKIDLKFSQEEILQFLKECPEHKLW